jgi:nucleoside phosphorylase/mannose-1-phosphate guanylyltransferase
VTRVEANAVRDVFDTQRHQGPQPQLIDGKTYFDLGVVNGARIRMVQSQMGSSGPGASLMTIHEAIKALHPTAVIMSGIAFGVNPKKQELGDILVSRKLVTYEQQKIKEGTVIPRGERVSASPSLLEKFESASLDWQKPNVHFGSILSGEKLIADQDFRNKLLELEPEAIGGEMEGAGLYAAASRAKVDWILVKAICDWADGNKADDHHEIAARNAAEFVLHVLEHGRPSEGMPHFSEILKDYERCLDTFFDAESGAVFEAEREDGTPKFLFTEVTGYAIKDFLLLYSLTGNEDYLDRAKKCAAWIEAEALDPCGGVRTRFYFEKDTEPELIELSFHGRRIYAFDTAVCLSGLLALYEITKDSSYKELSLKMGQFLITHALSESEGEVIPIYNATNGTRLLGDQTWSKRFGAFHSKVAEALIDLYSVTRDDTYRQKAILICREALRFQKLDGNFETSVGKTELHPHCYAAEGLLHVGLETGDQDLINAARRATEWALNLSQHGEIPQLIHLKEETRNAKTKFRTDALAQVLALAVDLRRIAKLDPKYDRQMREIARKLLDMKSVGDGYFRYGFYEQEFKGKLQSDTRSYWTNMFSLRALYNYFLAALLAKTDLLILAGGIGSRCWPISSETRPKHLSMNLLGNRSLLQETIRRYTHNTLIQPHQIYILCSEAGREQTWKQANGETIPYEHILVETDPEGTVPAVWKMLDELASRTDRDGSRILVISMADDVIEPYEHFQQALVRALFAVNQTECLVSVGKPFEKNQSYDNRFGYMTYSQRMEPYRCYQVNRFREKPAQPVFEELRQGPDHMAWEGGTVVVSETYFRKVSQDHRKKGNLAEHLLSKAAAWSAGEADKPIVAVSLLHPSTRFEDFGVPGQNLHTFFRGDEKYDLGSGNICLGNPKKIQMLYCSNNLIIADELPMKLYGLNGYLIIDNSWTNTTVLMPLKDADRLPNLYRVLQEPDDLKPFITGGREAALPESADFFARHSPRTSLKSDHGLLFANNCSERIHAERQIGSVTIFSQELPEVKPEDYENLYDKQFEDPKLVEHLVHVAALAEYFRGDEISMSRACQDMLRLLCLYHDYGGYLSDEKERVEADVVRSFQKISRLDRRLLDTRIINELLESVPETPPIRKEELIGLMNDSVNSAVAFLRSRKLENAAIRDIVLFLIQIQDAPGLFAGFRNTIEERFGFHVEEIEQVYACFKIADHFSNSRWLWKRNKYHTQANPGYQGFLSFDQGPLEDFSFTLTFTIDWFQKAQIEPTPYINRLNDILTDEDSAFSHLLSGLQGDKEHLAADLVYCYLLKNREALSRRELETMVQKGVHDALHKPNQSFQLSQIIELPNKLKKVMFNSVGIDKEAVNLVADILQDAVQANRQEINRAARHSHDGREGQDIRQSIIHLLDWEDLT